MDSDITLIIRLAKIQCKTIYIHSDMILVIMISHFDIQFIFENLSSRTLHTTSNFDVHFLHCCMSIAFQKSGIMCDQWSQKKKKPIKDKYIFVCMSITRPMKDRSEMIGDQRTLSKNDSEKTRDFDDGKISLSALAIAIEMGEERKTNLMAADWHESSNSSRLPIIVIPGDVLPQHTAFLSLCLRPNSSPSIPYFFSRKIHLIASLNRRRPTVFSHQRRTLHAANRSSRTPLLVCVSGAIIPAIVFSDHRSVALKTMSPRAAFSDDESIEMEPCLPATSRRVGATDEDR
ncbi:Zwittermicin A resistance protein zmaR [Striga asiatica]|uniref:Zwittermicin A resistance protein zmaR n=1 Tax=Striga asiatica TaxID=4170 RepID=A0A5A7QMW4_STRAF|nr:Zwittermicin A resistance protein zmaR [Striga asiatica]